MFWEYETIDYETIYKDMEELMLEQINSEFDLAFQEDRGY